jgi:hypothetical protein
VSVAIPYLMYYMQFHDFYICLEISEVLCALCLLNSLREKLILKEFDNKALMTVPVHNRMGTEKTT